MKYSLNPNGQLECYTDECEFIGIVGMMEPIEEQEEQEEDEE